MQAINDEVELTDPDPWTQRLYDILMLRRKYQEGDKKKKGKLKSFAKSWPLFNLLLNTFESTGIGSDREALEAAIIASDDSEEIANTVKRVGFTPAFINLYKKFFYDLGAVWKLLACSGGLKLLKEKGFNSAAIKPEDISYLLQFTCMRNCSMLLQYAAKGADMFEDKTNLQSFMLTLSDFDGIRGAERRPDGFAVDRGVNRNMYNSMLNEGVKLISAPDEIADTLIKADGAFHPELEEAREYVKHSFLENTIDE